MCITCLQWITWHATHSLTVGSTLHPPLPLRDRVIPPPPPPHTDTPTQNFLTPTSIPQNDQRDVAIMSGIYVAVPPPFPPRPPATTTLLRSR